MNDFTALTLWGKVEPLGPWQLITDWGSPKMNDIDAAVLAQTVLIFLAKRSLDQEECLQVAKLILNDKGLESLKNTKVFKELVEKADLT